MATKTQHWREVQRSNFTRFDHLINYLEIESKEKLHSQPRFVLNVPYRLAEKMEKGNVDDPLFRQFVPLKEEVENKQGFVAEPVMDSHFCCSERMLRKYEGRVLLVLTGACAMHCRYCFRQNFDYAGGQRLFQQEVQAIHDDSTIREVILSGGDPLSLSDEVLATLLQQIDAIPHVRAIRFHTRFPIGIPERIDDSFLSLLRSVKTQVWFVVHVNHPHELDDDVIVALSRVKKLGIPVLNQAVLLRDVNDTLEVQVALSKALTEAGIVPYYLHQLDRIKGAAHFEVSVEEGKNLVEEMAKLLPGYAVPRYVQEVPFEQSKTRIA